MVQVTGTTGWTGAAAATTLGWGWPLPVRTRQPGRCTSPSLYLSCSPPPTSSTSAGQWGIVPPTPLPACPWQPHSPVQFSGHRNPTYPPTPPHQPVQLSGRIKPQPLPRFHEQFRLVDTVIPPPSPFLSHSGWWGMWAFTICQASGVIHDCQDATSLACKGTFDLNFKGLVAHS